MKQKLSKEFVDLCDNATRKSMFEMNLPIKKIDKELSSVKTQGLTIPRSFDNYSYSLFKVIAKFLKSDREKLKFTQLIGKYIYSYISEKENMSNCRKNNWEQIKKNLKQVLKFFVDSGYVSKAQIKWDYFNINRWNKNGRGYLVYAMENPVILPSAKKLFNEEKFGQHYSSRTIEAALNDCGIIGREVKDFDPNNFKIENVEELWEVRKNGEVI